MKEFICFIIFIGIIPVSYYTMVNGWGLEPKSMEWVLFGYAFMMLTPIIEVFKERS